MRRFSLAQLEGTPWRNGGGLTREIAFGTSGAPPAGKSSTSHDSSEWDWRLSVASIDATGAFSSFVGVDRVAALVDGALRLDSVSTTLAWTKPGEVHAFRGEDEFLCRLFTPKARFFNVMVRRDAMIASVKTHTRSVLLPASQAVQRCVLVLSGCFEVGADDPTIALNAEDGLLCEMPSSSLVLAMSSSSGCLVDVQLFSRRESSIR